MRKLGNARGRQTWMVVASAAIMAAAMGARGVRGQTWLGPGTDWNTAANWGPATVPNSSTAAVIFTDTGAGTVNISSNVSAQSLTFNNPTTSYTLTSSAGVTLSNVVSITVTATVTQPETINLANVSTGSLLFPGSNNLTITNNSQEAFPFGVLTIGPNTVIGTPGSGGVIFAGPGSTVFAGSFASNAAPNNQVVGGLTKTGPGLLDYTGDGGNLIGGLTINGGATVLYYTTNTASKLGGGALTLDGGVLELAAGSTNVSQTIPGGIVVNAGGTDIVFGNQGGTITLAAGAITHNLGGTVDFFSPPTSVGPYTISTSTGNTNSLLGTGPAFATYAGGGSWATVAGGNITGLTTFGIDTYAAGTNTNVTVAASVASITTNSLLFNTGNLTLTLSGTNTLQSGGILVTPNAAGATITGGALTAPGGGELLLHVYGPSLTINSSLISNNASTGGLTKTGPGTLILGGTNGSLTGPININLGGLAATAVAAVNSASQINFNSTLDQAVNPSPQVFTVSLGNSASGTITPPIRLSAYGFAGGDDYGTLFSTGNSTGSTITLGGVISSNTGLTTPIRFTGPDNTSEFNLININTFTGNISLVQGSLGINSDLSLGNSGNTLYLEVNSSTQGGLVFLNSGINVAHAVALANSTRIVSNGTDSNTISGAISGGGTLLKDGTGTLTLSNPANTFSGGIQVTAGTLSLGSTGSVANGTNVYVAYGAMFNPGTTFGEHLGALSVFGTFRATAGNSVIFVNQILTGASGGTIDLTGAGYYDIEFNGASPSIIVDGTSTWLSPANNAEFFNTTGTAVLVTIQPPVTLTNGIALAGGGGFRITGGGTLFQNSDGTDVVNMSAAITVAAATTFRVTDASSNGGVGNLGTGTFTLDGGTFSYGGATAATSKPMSLTSNNGTIQVESATATLTANGAITGPGALTKIGPGILALGSSGNTFSSLTVNAGTIQTANDNTLGTRPITVNAAGTLLYSASTASSRTFNLNSGTLQAGSGATVTLSGATVNGGFMRGPGTFALTNNAALNGVTTFNSTTLTTPQFGTVYANNFTNGGTINLINGTLTVNGGTNIASGIINDNSGLVTVDFTNNGVVNVGSSSTLDNYYSNVYLGGGARLYIGTQAGPGGFLTLHGATTLEVNGALLVNDGTISGTTDVNYGGQAQGIGTYGPVNVSYGGLFQPGFASSALPGNGASVSGLAGSGTIDNATAGGNMALTLTGSSSSTFSGPIQNTTGTLSLAIQGTSSLTLLTTPLPGGGQSTNSYSGGTSIAPGGTLIIGASGALPAGGNVTNNGAFFVNATSTAGIISGTGSLTLGTAASPANLILKAGSGASKLSSLTLNSTSQLDLTNNPLILEAASAGAKAGDIAELAAAVLSGRNGGTWNGPGVTSSTVAANPTHLSIAIADNALLPYTTFGGQSVDSNSILAVPAVLGDVNLDGIVNAADFTILASNFHASNVGWTGGDFNNDGVVNFADFAALSNNFGDTFAAISSSALPASASGVPEPASLALLGAGLLGLAGRRRMRSLSPRNAALRCHRAVGR